MYTPYLVEKAGTSIPFSRGHYQSTGEGSLFGSNGNPDGDEKGGGRAAAELSLTTWDTYEDSNAGTLEQQQQHLAHSIADHDSSRTLSAAPDPGFHRAPPLKAFRVQTPTKNPGLGKSKSPSRSRLQLARSHMPGFSFFTKTEGQVKTAHDASKVYKRVKLPDGTPVIVPVSLILFCAVHTRLVVIERIISIIIIVMGIHLCLNRYVRYLSRMGETRIPRHRWLQPWGRVVYCQHRWEWSSPSHPSTMSSTACRSAAAKSSMRIAQAASRPMNRVV